MMHMQGFDLALFQQGAADQHVRRPRKGRCLEPIKPIKNGLVFRSPILF